MRSTNHKAFREAILSSKRMFSRASQLFHSTGQRGFEVRCLAWWNYLAFYLAKNPPSKLRTLEKSWRLAKQAFRIFDDSRDHLEFVKTYDQLATVVGLGFDFHSTAKMRGQRLKEGVDYGRQSCQAILAEDDKVLLARMCAKTALFIDAIGNEGSEIEFNEERDKEGLELWKRAERLDKNEALFQVGFPPGGFFRIVDEQESHRIHNEALEVARSRGDRLAIGWLLSQQSGWVFFDGVRSMTLSDGVRWMKKSLRIAEEAASSHVPSQFTSPNCGILWCIAPYAEHFNALSWFQKDEKSRMLLLEKARRETPYLLKQARLSGYPQALAYADHVASKILMEIGLRESGSRQKMKLLRQALKHRLRACKITARVQPNDLHRNGTYISRLGEIRAGIADLLEGRQAKIKMLSQAVRDKGRSVGFATEYTTVVSRGRPHLLGRMLGVDLIVYGDLLMRLYKVARDDETLGQAAKAYSDAAGFLKDSTAYRRLGEAYWKAGQIFDRQRANIAAAESFANASKAYQTLAEKSSDIGPVFLDYARYLEAWSNIEFARASHGRSDYEASKKFFEKAADLHQLAGRWSFLAPYYAGLAKLDSAESLSRMGRSPESMSAFKDASEMFRESSASLQKHANTIDQREEKTMVEGIALAFKEEYSLARMMIEEARVAEDQGDNQTSSNKFHEASVLLESSARKATMKREKDELLYISTLCNAWDQMAQTSPAPRGENFRQAASLFVKSMEYSPDEDANNLSMGHKHFCDALAASGSLTETLDPALYQKAVASLTVASNHFATANYRAQSKHAQACKLLLDAHANIANANTNPDKAERARSYEQATAILNDAARSFSEAHQTAKQEHVLRLIDNIHEQLGLSQRLAEISKAGGSISPTVAFPTPARGGEFPVGVSRFTGPDIEARYGASTSTGSSLGNDVVVEIVISNTGSQPIRLVKISDIIPKVAQLIESGAARRVEAGSLSLDHRRVEPMKRETFQIRLQPKRNHPIILKPTVWFTDDTGESLQFVLPQRVLVNSPILEYLTGVFLVDYEVKRLAPDQCGWRTLLNIVSSLKIPRSHVYGDPRWHHAYGGPLEVLVKSGLVEARRFGGERGRGGEIVKVRLVYENDAAKQYAATRTREHSVHMSAS
jgi:hypothetical protein